MDTVKWAHSSSMEADDILVSDNLLEFVKDEDIVTGLDNPDDILPQDIFNEIIDKFDFNDTDVNINSFLNELTTSNANQLTSNSNFTVADPLLSSSNASINYNNFRPPKVQTQSKVTTPPITNFIDVNSTSQLVGAPIKTTSTHMPPTDASTVETVVYNIADKSVGTNPFVTTAAQIPSPAATATVLSNLTPIQMVFNNVETTNFQPVSEYSEVSESSNAPVVAQSSGGLLRSNTVVECSTQSIILNPTVVYTSSTPISSNSIQSVQLINTTDGTIFATQVPMPTIMVEREQKKAPKVKEVKRSTHNAIERRYRTSINDKIVELKNMLVGDSGKLNKSAILKQSIEKIHDLESENYELKLQNARLREVLLGQGPIVTDDSALKALLLQRPVNPHKRRYTQSSSAGSEYGGNISPSPTSDESNPSLSPAHSDTGSIPLSPLGSDEISTDIDRSAKRNKKTRMDNITTHGMSSISKLTLCAFMFAIITINPFASLFPDSPANAVNLFDEAITSRRTILNVDIENMTIFQTIWQRFNHSFIALILNVIILTVCLVKLCLHSDPVMNFHSPVAEKYFKQKLIADTEFDEGNASAAFIAYEKCLQMFGVTLPSQSWFDLIPMTIWQFLRCCAHRLRFGQWLSRKFGRIIRSNETQENVLNSAQELAIVLNRCNQIHLSQDIGDGCGLILSMYAVNMAEVARNIAPLTLIDVYLTAALRCKKNYVYFFSWICSRYYLYKARSVAAMLCGQKLPPKYNWIFNSVYGYKYMCKFSFDGNCNDLMSQSLFNSKVNQLDTLSVVFTSYNRNLLKSALQCLIGVSYTSNNDIKSLECNDATVIRDVLNYAQLLQENNNDPLVFWWANLFSIDACWLLGDDEMADKMFEDICKIPKTLRESKDPLGRAAVTIFCAKKLLAMKQPNRIEKTWSLCNCASKLFAESLLYNKAAAKDDMIGFVQLLICDWLLETRTACWEMKQNAKACVDDDNNNYVLNNPLSSKELEQFQNDINSLYCIIDQIPTAKPRIYLYEAMSRLMAGAAPGYTQELLDRSFHEQYRRNNHRSAFHCGSGQKENQTNGVNETTAINKRRCGQSSTLNVDGERERAAAIYVACKYLPTPLCLPGERFGMLAEAAKTLKKIGNRKKLNDCYKLMQSFRTTTVPTN